MKTQNRGFSLIELLLVIAVMGILATLLIGGVLKATTSAHIKRVHAMCRSLEIALIGFKAQEGRWTVELEPNTKDGKTLPILSANDKNYDPQYMYKATFTGKNNKDVFDDLIPKKGSKTGQYLSAAEFLTKLDVGGVVSLREAIDGKNRKGKALSGRPFPLGYADPYDRNKFRFFRVEFNLLTDSVKVGWAQDGDADYQK